MDIQFVNHIQAGLAEQDVFIEKSSVPVTEVIRPVAEDVNGNALPLYAAASAVKDDPFKVEANPLGPFTKGRALGLSLQQWLQARGGGTYTPDGERSELHLKFEGLVPNGSYTVLTPRISFPPNFSVQPGIAGAPDGSQAMMHADASGRAAFDLTMNALPESTKETASVIILAYNSEGAWRGEFGKNTHQQLVAFLPAPAGL